MTRMMTAAVLYGREDLRLEQVERPEPAPGELVIRVGAALTCGTDLKVYRRGYHATMLKPPIPFGHEVAGVVDAVGEGTREFRPGDRVVALNSAPCDVCFWCLRGQQNLCDDLLFNNGAYAEYLRIPARIVAKNTLAVPAEIPLRHAALTEPLACVVRGFEETGARAGDSMAVIGAGPIGLMFLHLASLQGLHVIAVVKRPAQAEAARVFGAAEVICLSGAIDSIAAVRALTPDARGVDIAIDAVATPATWEQAVAMARRGGVVNFFGGPPAGTSVQLDTNRLHYGEITLKASFHHTPTTARTAFALITGGRFNSEAMITAQAGLGETAELFRRMARGQPTDGVAEERAAARNTQPSTRVSIKTAVLPAGREL